MAEEKGNIAVLAHAVVGKTGVKPTLQLYIRLAFLVSQGSHCDRDVTDTLHRGGISLTTRLLTVTSGGLKLMRIWLSGERSAILRWHCLRT